MKKLLLIACYIFTYGCVMHKSDLKITVVNQSKQNLYLGGLYSNCDSCDIMKDVADLFLTKKEQLIVHLLKAKDSIGLQDKLLFNSIKLYAIDADSLDQYCSGKLQGSIIKKIG